MINEAVFQIIVRRFALSFRLIAFAASSVLFSCDNKIELAGNVSQVETTIDDYFNSLGVQDGFELIFEQTENVGRKIVIETDDNILPRVKYEIKKGILFFYKDKSKEFPNDTQVKIRVYADSINTLTVSEAIASIVDTLKVSSLKMNFFGTSLFRSGAVKSEDLDLTLNEGSTVALSGNVLDLVLKASGGSSFKSFDLISDEAELKISGGSAIELTVNNKLSLEAIETSAIIYDGDPEIGKLTLKDDSRLDRRK
ncbi:MAG: DUF2807 domain-containing protein [Prevotellaceae bacterium]|jgi:hypothetical protein|nr:DUF2807 domain-containing protein [Prevotellaceae bacterium]